MTPMDYWFKEQFLRSEEGTMNILNAYTEAIDAINKCKAILDNDQRDDPDFDVAQVIYDFRFPWEKS